MNKLNFNDIPQFTRGASYRVNVGWDYLEEWITQQQEKGISRNIAILNLDPDFQRGYVWTDLQKTRYIEYILRGGLSGRDLYFNCVGWMNGFSGPYVIVDGKQRLDAVRGFLRGEVRAFDRVFSEFEGKLRMTGPGFVVNINDLKTCKEVLTWYLDLNSGGTVHTDEELNRVKALLEKAK